MSVPSSYQLTDVRTAAEAQGAAVQARCAPDYWTCTARIFRDGEMQDLSQPFRYSPMTMATLNDVMLVDALYPVIGDKFVYWGMHHNAANQAAVLIDQSGQPKKAFLFRTRGYAQAPVQPGVSFLLGGVKDNIWHFFYNFVTRLSLVAESEDDYLRKKAPLVINYDLPQRFRPFLTALGFDESRLVEATRKSAARFESLVVGELPFFTGDGGVFVTPAATRFVQDKLPAVGRTNRRIYISRRDARWRRILNEEEVVATVKKFDFEVVEMSGLDAGETIKVMAEADVVIGASGANLGPVLFCRPGAKVVELTYPPYTSKYYFQGASSMGGLLHYKLEGEAQPSASIYHRWDFRVDTERLAQLLEAIL